MRGVASATVGALVLAAASPAGAAQVRLAYPALERFLVSRVLTEGGRLYLEGAPGDECRYAFIQEPHVSAVGSRLRIQVLFSGRAGTSVASRCVGPGDTLQLDIQGVPAYADGVLRLDSLSVDAPDSAYFKLVSGLVSRWLQDRLTYPLRDELAGTLAWLSSSGVARLQLRDLQVRSVLVEEAALVLDLDFDLAAD